MLCRRPGFRMIQLLARPLPPPSPVCLSLSVFLDVADRAYSREKEGRGGRGVKSYVPEKAWFSINHSILSDQVVVEEEAVEAVLQGAEAMLEDHQVAYT